MNSPVPPINMPELTARNMRIRELAQRIADETKDPIVKILADKVIDRLNGVDS